MREFYRSYENVPEILQQAMQIGWTQNVVIMEADLSLQDKAWVYPGCSEVWMVKSGTTAPN